MKAGFDAQRRKTGDPQEKKRLETQKGQWDRSELRNPMKEDGKTTKPASDGLIDKVFKDNVPGKVRKKEDG
jgi:hypothetical protein